VCDVTNHRVLHVFSPRKVTPEKRHEKGYLLNKAIKKGFFLR
jgi:hypothetical protein